MKYIITERQLNLIKESEEKVLHIPTLKLFNDDWELLQQFLNKKGNPPYSIGVDLNLSNTNIKSLGNLISVDGNLYSYNSNIESLGNLTSVGGYLDLSYSNIESIGNLTSVGGYLDLYGSKIKSLGNLTSVGGYLDLRKTPLSEIYSEEEIHKMINIGGRVYL